MRKKVFIVLTILWMAMIFYMSNQPANISSAQSGGVVEFLSTLPIIGSIIEPIMANGIAEVIVRKGAHMFSYAMLSVLCFMSMHENNVDLKKVSLKSILIAFLYACSDEFHQLFVLGRSGEFRDVMIDTTGAVIAISILYFIIKNIKNKQLKKSRC